VFALAVLVVLGVALGCALWYDVRQRRRGIHVRSGSELDLEATHHRIDINAVPYEPARHAGQRDWATYRRRDLKPPGRQSER
jgi:Flp pilus assembly protein TadB